MGSRRLVFGFLALLVNSAYLASRADPSLFYFANVALHVALGLVLAVFAAPFALARWSRLTRLAKLGALLLATGAALGAFLIVSGATSAYRGVLYAHIGSAALGSAILAASLCVSALRSTRRRERRMAPLYPLALSVLAAVPLVARISSEADWQRRHRIANPSGPPASMEQEGGGPSSPFFPSSATTTAGGTIPADFFLTSATCGRCHRDIYRQWSSSAHRFSSFNNQWYRKSIEYMQDVVGTRPSKWCAGCHDHAVFFNGRFDRPIKEQIDTAEAQAGLACTSCHAIVRVGSSMGQGDFVIEYPPLHDLASSDRALPRWLHDTLLYLDPEPHRKTFLKPFHTEQPAEFCSSCHKVHLDGPVNNYRWVRGFNEYDNWQASGVSGQGARSFYYPAKPQTCSDCHMPLVPSNDPAARDGQVRSHRFPAANTALAYVNQDREQLKVTEDFLRDGQISVDIFGLTRAAPGIDGSPQSGSGPPRPPGATEPRPASTFARGEESSDFGAAPPTASAPITLVAPLDRAGRARAVVRRGEPIGIEVVVRTRKVGHFFPGGTVDAVDAWVELEAEDETGRTLFHSGFIQDAGQGPVDPGAHFYRSLQLDEHGNVINKRNAWMTRSVAYVRLIPPGAADTVHYRLEIPEDCGDTILVRARVNYRKFPWWNTQWAFAGIRDPAHEKFSLAPGHDDGRWIFAGNTSGVSGRIKAIPVLPVTVMAQAEAALSVVAAAAPVPAAEPSLDKAARERWNDYGIGLLLQGDVKGAERAFRIVTEIDPGYADGWVNVARSRIQEGDMESAVPPLERALDLDPALGAGRFFLAVALKSLGRYDEALEHLRIAGERYPRDRVVLNQRGRILFLKRAYREAIAELQKVLAIDPEDLQAHYNLMLCFRGLGQTELAAREEKLYARFKADESSQFLTGPFRRLNPHDNNERQAIHEHR